MPEEQRPECTVEADGFPLLEDCVELLEPGACALGGARSCHLACMNRRGSWHRLLEDVVELHEAPLGTEAAASWKPLLEELSQQQGPSLAWAGVGMCVQKDSRCVWLARGPSFGRICPSASLCAGALAVACAPWVSSSLRFPSSPAALNFPAISQLTDEPQGWTHMTSETIEFSAAASC